MTDVLPPLRDFSAMGTLVAGRKKVTFPLSNWGGTQTMVTSYSMDFGKKEGRPSEPRPCSATRRNRPHPSKYFMNWRVPSKPILDGKRGYVGDPKESEYSKILQNFYDEYRGKYEPKRNGPSPNIFKEITIDEKVKLMERLKISGKPVDAFQFSLPQLNPEALSIVANLLKKATPQEQEILEKAFIVHDKDSSRDQPSHLVISSEAISILEQVLQKAGITDNDAAIRFLLSIGQVLMSISKLNGPATPRPKAPTEEKERRHLRSPPIRSPNLRVHKHKDGACALCNKSSLNNELRDISSKNVHDNVKLNRSYLENVPRLPKIRAPKRSSLARPRPWHNLPSYPPRGKVENKLATFVLPHRPIPRSFTIHPEWD